MSPPKPKTKLRELAYDLFTRNLLTARLRPGQFVSQRELVEMMGVPLAAIREVIPRLEAEKLLATVPQRGLQVASVDLRMVREVVQLWMILARAAAERLGQTASDDVLDALHAMHKDLLLRAARLPDAALVENAGELERRFHALLIDGLGNAIIADIYRVNRIKITMIRIARGGDGSSDVVSSTREQMAIIEALRRRDPKQLINAVEDHADATLQRAVMRPASSAAARVLPANTQDAIIAA